MRDVLDRLEVLGLRWLITGSEALGRYGEPRFTADLDVVVETNSAGFPAIVRGLEGRYLASEAIDFNGHTMASLVSMTELAKVDLILEVSSSWEESAMSRRKLWEHPTLGRAWVISLEDLIVAKLAWSEGVSELQLRDCRNLVRMNERQLDWPYLNHWAAVERVAHLLDEVRHES